jgi:hypothetical protein
MGNSSRGGVEYQGDEVNITIEVNNIDQIIIAPEKDPYSSNPIEYMGHSALERCFMIVSQDRHWNRKTYRFIFLVPPDQVGKRSVVDIKQAIRRFCKTQREDNEAKLKVIRRKGMKQLPYAIAILFIFVTSGVIIGSDAFVEMSPLLATSISEGLYIIGWVSLWGPTDTLLFEPVELKRENKVLKMIEEVEIDVVPRISV